MRTPAGTASRALPRGLRVRRRQFPLWPSAVALVAGGLLLGTILTSASLSVLFGMVAVFAAAGLTILRPALGLAVLAFTYPFDLTTRAGPVKLTTSAALIGILLIVWLVRLGLPDPPPLRTTPLDMPVLFFVGATMLSLFGLTGHVDEQLVGLLKALGGFLLFFLASQIVRAWSDLWLVIGAVLATGLLQAGTLSVQVLSGSQIVSEQTRAAGTLVQPNLFAGYLVLTIPLLVAIGVAFRQRWASFPTAVATLILSIALVATLSRSGWLGLLAGTLLLGVLLGERRWRIAAIAVTVAAVLLIAGLVGPIGDRLAPHASGPWEMLLSRWSVWMAAVGMTAHHPVFGVGVSNFQYFYPLHSGDQFGLNHAHNLFLNIAAERGLPALLAFGILVVALFQTLLRVLRTAGTVMDRALVAGLVASLAAYLVHSIFEVSYYDYKVLLLFWLLLAVAASLPRLLAQASRDGLPGFPEQDEHQTEPARSMSGAFKPRPTV